MRTNDCLQLVFSESDLIQAALAETKLETVVTDDIAWANQYRKMREYFDLDVDIDFLEEVKSSPDKYFRECRSKWYIPEEYKNFDIKEYLLNLCSNSKERDRVLLELSLYEQAEMLDVLTFLHYFITTLRNNRVVWGVGRGSSVASFVLYLLGVHRINSLAYDLDIGEFIRWQK
jgi:DNA polymerase III alpha subunit